MVAAVDDDHVLGTADDEQVSVRQIPHVAGVEPAVPEARRRRLGVAKIARHHRYAAAPQLADRALGKRRAVFLADLHRHVAHRASAIDDRAIALRATRRAALGGEARQLRLLDQLGANAFARRHQRYRERRLRQTVGRQKRGRLKPRIGERVDEVLHHIGADHVRAIARQPPARQVEAPRRPGLRRHPPRADVIAESRRIGERRPRMAADQIEPGERTAREIFGFEIVGRHLVGDRREHAADQPHVVIPGQPRDAAVPVAHLHAVTVRGEVVEQRAMGDRDPMRKARRAARILQIRDRVGVGDGQRRGRRGAGGETVPIDRLHPRQPRRFRRHRRELGRVDQQVRLAAVELDTKLLDIGVAPAERGRQRQRHRPRARIDRAEEQGGELGAGLRDQRHALFGLHARREQTIRDRERVLAQLGEGISANQGRARVVEVQPARAGRGIVERRAQGSEVGETARQGVIGGRRAPVRRRGAVTHYAIHPIHRRPLWTY